MPSKYLKQCLKDLDKDLRRLPRQERLRALEDYEIGLKYSFFNDYPNRFPLPGKIEPVRDLFHSKYFEKGKYVGMQFGSMEVDFAREFLLAEVGKRKTKFSKKSFWDYFRK